MNLEIKWTQVHWFVLLWSNMHKNMHEKTVMQWENRPSYEQLCLRDVSSAERIINIHDQWHERQVLYWRHAYENGLVKRYAIMIKYNNNE